MSKVTVGIIAEDDSDVECVKHFVRRIHSTRKIGFKKYVGNGCGKISRKANAWANMLKMQGCGAIILLHDLDRNNLTDLYDKIHKSFSPSPVKKFLISIPVEELEAWLLADEAAFNSVFNISRTNYLPQHPESIKSPKEFIRDTVRKETNRKVDYINTKHNSKLAERIDINMINTKCTSFQSFKSFVDAI
ncbi:DUF4276 family protein [Geomonas paludis]|uniref:DUF4276 family protein n=1 Tax=Geomonas paludis TaxID=2740185 RepID=A0A6V8MW77_9BACT|nr:DUF4276 family protein [Geomonas paludis]UPU34139.1 DUF4276 family protein [Geomonas paludis]GFO64114.1 hypothetical protein GMPD_20330 [Geomonas paludis]